jgi:enamine deaminase RidA (YjgF/YER057c/UK114 family)
MQYGDRNHVYISGTASINNKGEVMHVGNVQQQTLRMWENVETLLNEGGMSYDDVMQIIVYLRDSADYEMVKRMFEQKFPDIPTVFTLAPVCRPTWLIEMECMAVKKAKNDFRDF